MQENYDKLSICTMLVNYGSASVGNAGKLWYRKTVIDAGKPCRTSK